MKAPSILVKGAANLVRREINSGNIPDRVCSCGGGRVVETGAVVDGPVVTLRAVVEALG